MRPQRLGGTPAALAIVLAFGGCTAARDGPATTERLAGTATYRERMALPPGAALEVRLEDIAAADAPATMLAEQIVAVGDRQVPIPFELAYEPARIQANRRYGVRAAIRGPDGGLLFTTTSHQPAFTDGRPVEPLQLVLQRTSGDPAAAVPETGRTFVFDCDDDVRFTVRTGPGEVALSTPAAVGGEYLVLAATPTASGARYQAGETVFWNRGETALIEVGGRTFADCRSNPAQVPWADAARRGATFRGLGNEPSWYVEIFADRFALVTELGARRTELPYATPATSGSTTTYRATGAPTTIVVEQRACNDSMSGEGFEAAVTVTLEDRVLHGCGRAL